MDDVIRELLSELSQEASNWRKITNDLTGDVAFIPETAKDVEDWERRCLEMHEGQEKIVLPERPQESVILERKQKVATERAEKPDWIKGTVQHGRVIFTQ